MSLLSGAVTLHWALGPGEDWNTNSLRCPVNSQRLHWALGPGEDWNPFSFCGSSRAKGLHWALGPGEDWNTGLPLIIRAKSSVALGLRAW